MFTEALIPFGVHKESNRLVDVGSVAKGKACGCICPSCQTPLIARQGHEKEWHFAHRSHDVHNETRKECDYSLPVSIRMMIRQPLNDPHRLLTCFLSVFSRMLNIAPDENRIESSYWIKMYSFLC